MNAPFEPQLFQSNLLEQIKRMSTSDLIALRTAATELIDKAQSRQAAINDWRAARAAFDADPVPMMSNEELNALRR